MEEGTYLAKNTEQPHEGDQQSTYYPKSIKRSNSQESEAPFQERVIYPTVQNIYQGKVEIESSPEAANEDTTIVTRSPSTRRKKLNRSTYARLHRKSNVQTFVDRLREKYEDIGKQTEDKIDTPESANKSSTGKCECDNASDKIAANNGFVQSDALQDYFRNNSQKDTQDFLNAERGNTTKGILKDTKDVQEFIDTERKYTAKETLKSAQDTQQFLECERRNILETISHFTQDSQKFLDAEREKSDEKDEVSRTADHISQLQNNLKVKLSKETVEELKNKYSPTSFGYPRLSKSNSFSKVQFSDNCPKLPKVPIPKPRISLTKDDALKWENIKSEFEKPESPKENTLPENNKEEFVVIEPVRVTSPTPEQPVTVFASSSTLDSILDEVPSKDHNFNYLGGKFDSNFDSISDIDVSSIKYAEPEEKHFVLKESSSEDSVKQVSDFLSDIVMEKKPKEKKKRSGSFRSIMGNIFGKDKSKTKKNDKTITDNSQNESSSFVRNSAQRHTIGGSHPTRERNPSNQQREPYYANRRTFGNEPDDRGREMEERFAQTHINKFNDIKNNFTKYEQSQNYRPSEDYICMDQGPKNINHSRSAYSNNSSINKYIDTSSSTSTLESDKQRNTYENSLIAQAELRLARQNNGVQRSNSYRGGLPPSLYSKRSSDTESTNRNGYSNSPERFSETPPRAQSTYQNLQLIKPKAVIPISSERPLPNPYHNDSEEDRQANKNNQMNDNGYKTIERNMNNDDGKQYPGKSPSAQPYFDDTYGTVFDCVDYDKRNRKMDSSPSPQSRYASNTSPSTSSSPRSPSLEGSKLRLPSNRERVELQPRLKSPIPPAKVSTEKIIATELLRTARSPTPTRKAQNVRSSPSHQRLEIPIDYPEVTDKTDSPPTSDNKDNAYRNKESEPVALSHSTPRHNGVEIRKKPPVSPRKPNAEQYLEAAEWYKRQKEIDQFPTIPVESPTLLVTSAVVHSDPSAPNPNKRPETPKQNMYPVERATTPVNHRLSTSSIKTSPEKQEIRQHVEAYCWKELKKLKDQKELELYYYQQAFGCNDDSVLATRKSRSASQIPQRGRRSLSLPREMRPVKAPIQQQEMLYGTRQQYPPSPVQVPRQSRPPLTPIPQEAIYGQFIRNSPIRRTIGPVGVSNQQRASYDNYSTSSEMGVRPIFNRGSLSNQDFVDSQTQSLKRVSFSNPQSPYWPTKDGLTQSPPQRRPEKQRDNSVDDEVFVPASPRVSSRTDAVYGQRIPARAPQEAIYGRRTEVPVGESGIRSSKQSLSREASSDRELNAIYQQNLQRIPSESLYGRSGHKQIRVNNKYADMYGQIHDTNEPQYALQKSGVVYGQLQQNPNVSFHPPPSGFVRGTRLTASANDMYKRLAQSGDPRYRSDTFAFEPIYEKQHVPNGHYGYGARVISPNRPLPPLPNERSSSLLPRSRRYPAASDTESDVSDFRRVAQQESVYRMRGAYDEEWNPEGKSGRGFSGNESGGGRGGDNDGEVRGRSRSARREDPRRHTLGGDQQYSLMSGQGGPLSRTMDLEGQPRGYPPPSNAMLFDDDPGIMSEVETSSTGFRRGGKQRSSLPVVRTPSKTLERPLGLVFLQYRNETKRALLPNEITSIDTVKALFVRSFPKQLTMDYLDSPQVKIYIHDSSKDMFYELEDLRSHLREIRDRSVLRLFESADVTGGLPMAGIGIAGGVGHFEDPSYFSEPEFDSEYQHQHIHKSKASAAKGAPYYMGSTASLPRGAALLRTYSPAVGALPGDRLKTLPTGAPPKPQRSYSSGAPRSVEGPGRPSDRFAPFPRPTNSLFNLPDGYMSSPERGSRGYEEPYYSQYTSRSGSITPVIDEEISDTELLDDSYSLYGVKLPPGGPRPGPRAPFPPPAAVPYDATRLRVENMERQIANLTGLVQKALTQTPTSHLQVPGRDGYRSGNEFEMNSSSSSASLPDDSYLRSDSKTPKLGKSGCHKSVSFEKSVSFSDEPPDMNSPKQHSPQHAADTKPPKPAIKSSTLPRTSSQERDRLKPAPPPKPASLSPGQYDGRHIYRDLQLTPEMYNQLRGLQKKAKDLRAEVRNLRRMSQAQAHSVRETIRDTFIKIRAMLLAGGEQVWQAGMDQERVRLSREEDLYKQEMLRLEKDLSDLESTVEELRGNVINRKTRVNMSDVENMALVLSKSSKTVADLKLRFPGLQDGMKAFLSSEMEKVVREEKFLKEEPERLESALRRCKKLTGTLVTLKRLASVQEQRLPCSAAPSDGRISPSLTETPPVTPTSAQHSKSPSGSRVGALVIGGDGANSSDGGHRPENALDALLDELQTFSKPHPSTVSTQMPQDATSEPPAIPAKGIPPSHFGHAPSISEIGRKGSMDSASFLPAQTLTVSTATGSLRRLHSYPSGSDTDNSPPIQPLLRPQEPKTAAKPPIPERNAELLQHIAAGKRIPPPPPPRTSSKSPLASPTSPGLPPRSPAAGLQHIQNVQNMVDKPQSQFEQATQNLGLGTLRRNAHSQNRGSFKDKAQTLPRNVGSNLQIASDSDPISASNSSSCESVNSQDGSKKSTRKEELEQRHQELLKKQKALQEQYARLQQLQRGNNTLAVVPPPPDQLLKKTGSESNLLQKMGLQMSTAQMTGSLTHLPNTTAKSATSSTSSADEQSVSASDSTTTTSKVYETDIL